MTGRPYKNVPTSININPIYSTHCQPIHNHRRMDHLENWSPRSLAKVLKPTKLWFLIKNLHPSWFSSQQQYSDPYCVYVRDVKLSGRVDICWDYLQFQLSTSAMVQECICIISCVSVVWQQRGDTWDAS